MRQFYVIFFCDLMYAEGYLMINRLKINQFERNEGFEGLMTLNFSDKKDLSEAHDPFGKRYATFEFDIINRIIAAKEG